MRLMLKKTITWILAFIMILAMVPFANLVTFAEGETPEVVSITVDDVKILQGDRLNHQDGFYYYDIYPLWNDNIKVTFSDGSTLEGQYYQVRDDVVDATGYWLSFSAPDQYSSTYEDLWGVGSHQATVSLGDYTDTYNVIICENPIESFTVSDMAIPVHTNGSWYTDFEGNSYYQYYPWPTTYTLKMKDTGNTYSFSPGYSPYIPELSDFPDLSISINPYHEGNTWQEGSTNRVTAFYAGLSADYNVTITSSPIKEVIVKDFEILEKYNGYYVDPGTEHEYYYYYISPSTYTVVLNNGTTYDFSPNYYPNAPELNGFYFDITTQQNEDFQLEAGRTYTIDASYGGVKTSYKVTVVETPVAELKVDDVTLRQGIDNLGMMQRNMSYTVKMKNGTEYNIINGNSLEIAELSSYVDYPYAGNIFTIDSSDIEASYNWEAGTTHPVKAEFAGVETTFNVSIIENPIKAINLENDQITLIKNVDGRSDYWPGLFIYQADFYLREIDLIVTYEEDGIAKTESFSQDDLYRKFRTSVSTNSVETQRNHPWTEVNTPYPVTLSFAGLEKTVYFTLIETEASSYNWEAMADEEINRIAPNGVFSLNVAKGALSSDYYSTGFLQSLMSESELFAINIVNINTDNNTVSLSLHRKYGPDGSYTEQVKSYDLQLKCAQDNNAKKTITDKALAEFKSNCSVNSYGQSTIILDDTELIQAYEKYDSYDPFEIAKHIEALPQAASIKNNGCGITSSTLGRGGGMDGPIYEGASGVAIGISKDNVYYSIGYIIVAYRNVLYIPSETNDSINAFLAAAQNKIDEALGKGKAVIVHREKAETFYNYYSSPDQFGLDWLPLVCTDGIEQDNYFNQFEITFLNDDGTKKFTAPFNILREPEKTIYNDRIYAADRYGTAKNAGNKYSEITGKKFQNVVVACGTNFPDALAGGYLAKVKNAPILLVTGATENDIAAYIKTNMDPSGTVYLLGGTGVVSSSFETKIKNNNLNVKRLGGADRFATNIEILKEAGVGGQPILVCTGYGYADSLSASAVGLPILLVGDSISAPQREFLMRFSGSQFYLIGGTGAVKESVKTSLQKISSYYYIERIYGQTRYETSTEVAKRFFPKADNIVLAYAQNFPDGLSGGPLAMQIGAPIVLVDSNNTAAAASYVKHAGVEGSITLGGPALISDAAINRILDK